MILENDLVDSISELDEDKAIEIVNKLVKEEKAPTEIFNNVRAGMTKVGEKFASKEFFLADLIYSAEIFEEINKILMPLIGSGEGNQPLGKIVFGTVKNDIHDIGKNIVIGLLRAEGIEIIDLGVDQPAETFVKAVEKEKPDVVGLSGLLTLAIESMKNTIEAIKKIDEDMPVIVGGGPVDESVCKHVGADGWAPNAVEAVKVFKKFLD